ncbi:MAG: hypothetical protein H0U54_07505 [Acidobacteria bacterium]|nr:hypothetical protein [Acidobacteriota bacterium]
MAEEVTLEQVRPPDGDDNDELSKEELKRRMEEARETITQTVTEIKETVTNQYYTMKETVSDALDWRHHFRNNPVAFSLGSLSVGFLVGYGITGMLKGSGRDRDEDYPSSDESDVYARTNATPSRYEDESSAAERQSVFHGHSFASQPITAESVEDRSGYEKSSGDSLSYSAPRENREETPQKPGLYDRFKETSAYDRLQSEVSTLGERFMEELSSTAHNVVLPSLFNKVKELFGVDLSGKQNQQSQGSQSAQSSGGAQANTGARAASASASSSSAPLASASRGSSDASYATSENRGYGAQGATREGDEGSSVLDLDR